jgi:DNA polymerase I-like protein with 3'-5' exonuclease and polymerase domains
MTTLTAPVPKTENISSGTVAGTPVQQVTKGKRLVFDLEANGLWDADTIWCIATKDLDTGEERFYGPLEIAEGASALLSAEVLIGHNIIEYDIPLLERVHGIKGLVQKAYDTLVVSRLLNPDRLSPPGVKSSPHSLATWGYRLGKGKPEHEDWSQFSEEMKHRCQEDVRINELVYYALQEEQAGHDWSQAIELEMAVAEIMARQARDGVYFDVDAAKQGVLDLEKKIEEIDNELFPLLPVTVEQWGVEVRKPFLKSGQPSKDGS